MNTLEGQQEWCVQENYRKTTEVVRPCEENEEEYIVRRMLDVDMPGKRR